MTDVVKVRIERLGGRGDGVAASPLGPLFVPFTVPGDRVAVRPGASRGDGLAATLVELIEPGPARATPPCPHFGSCGGCALQHVAPADYLAWKRGLVVEALRQRGLDPPVGETVAAAPGQRRRARFALAAIGGRGHAGFNERASHRIVDLAACPVAAPPLVALLAPLRRLAPDILKAGGRGEAAATLTETGIDLLLRCDGAPGRARLERLAAFAAEADLARLSWQPPHAGRQAVQPAETIVRRRAPVVTFGGVAVELPPDGFVQPTAAGEAALRDLVRGALDGCRRVADLFAGCGSFAFALARAGARVAAFERDADAVGALTTAARRSDLAPRIEAAARDLDRRPLAGPELAPLDGVVLDPPRPGAAAQARALADSRVPVVAYVSCNAGSFARDARTLVDGGYRLERVTPVDQFLWSPHVEVVGVFRR